LEEWSTRSSESEVILAKELIINVREGGREREIARIIKD